jgi:hypothetical protein
MNPIHTIITEEEHISVFCSYMLLFLFIKRGGITDIHKWEKAWDGHNKKVEHILSKILRILIFPVATASLFISSVLIRNKCMFSPQFFRNIHPVGAVENILSACLDNILRIIGSAHLRIFFLGSSFSTVFTLKRISSFFGKNTSSEYTAVVSSFRQLKEYAEGELFHLRNICFQDRDTRSEMRNITEQVLYVFRLRKKTICGICSVAIREGAVRRRAFARHFPKNINDVL